MVAIFIEETHLNYRKIVLYINMYTWRKEMYMFVVCTVYTPLLEEFFASQVSMIVLEF
jgi:hypothetical protein